MADITASTAFRDFVADLITTAGGCYMWVTLHSDIASISPSTVYAATGLDELATGNGYTAGGKSCGTITQSGGVVDTPNVVWTTGSGETLTSEACCLWINDTNDITGAALVSMEDSTNTASNGGTMTANIVNPITIPTPS